jgi:hypothetical protein
MARSIVVALRMASHAVTAGRDGYLARARAMCMRAEEMAGSLVAWSATGFAVGWDVDHLEQAASFAASIRGESPSPEHAWAVGMAEGHLETLSPDGQGILAWGSALLWASSRADSARPGQVLLHDELRTLHGDQLGVSSGDGNESGRPSGRWQLDIDNPWTPGRVMDPQAGRQETASSCVVDSIAELRRARSERPPSAQCQATLALAMTLSKAGRPEEALLEAIDALAWARATQDARALAACTALLAKLYAGVGLSDAADALRDGMAGSRS